MTLPKAWESVKLYSSLNRNLRSTDFNDGLEEEVLWQRPKGMLDRIATEAKEENSPLERRRGG